MIGKSIVAAGPGRFQDVRKRLAGAGRERAVGIEIHRRLDLDARKPRRIGALVNLRQIALEALLDIAAARTGIAAGEDVRPLVNFSRRVSRTSGGSAASSLLLLHDRDIRHVALA